MLKTAFSLIFAIPFLLVLVSGAGTPAGAAEAGAEATKANLDLPAGAIGGEFDGDDDEDPPIENILFYTLQLEGDGFFFCMDRSSSMAGDKWTKLQREVVKTIQGFSEGVQFALVFFDATVNPRFPPDGHPAKATADMEAAATAMVMSTSPGNGTCGKEALIQALAYANQSIGKRQQIIFLSDGRQTCNNQDENEYEKATIAQVTARNARRHHINTILIGTEFIDENFMRELAAANNGQYRRIR